MYPQYWVDSGEKENLESNYPSTDGNWGRGWTLHKIVLISQEGYE